MFLGGTTEQWIQLLQYCIIVLVLGTGSVIFSCILTNKILYKKRKNNFKAKTKKKSYFIDVA